MRAPLLYAAAAILEGCSFVNGGSQNTVQPCLLELAAISCNQLELAASGCKALSDSGGGLPAASQTPPYVLGTDFKAGQTKAKTAIVES